MKISNKYIIIGASIIVSSLLLFFTNRGKGYSKLEKRIK